MADKIYTFEEAMQIFANKSGVITLNTRISGDGGQTWAQAGLGWGQQIWKDGHIIGEIDPSTASRDSQYLLGFKQRSYGFTKQCFLKVANQLLNGKIATGESVVIGENALNPNTPNIIFKVFLKADVEGFERIIDTNPEGDWSAIGL